MVGDDGDGDGDGDDDDEGGDPPPANVVEVTYGLSGYTEETFGETERASFRGAVAALLGVDEDAVRIVAVTNRDATRRRLLQDDDGDGGGVDVQFEVDVPDASAAETVAEQANYFAADDAGATTLVTSLREKGLSSVSEVRLAASAVVVVAPPPPTTTPSAPSPSGAPPLDDDDDDDGAADAPASSPADGARFAADAPASSPADEDAAATAEDDAAYDAPPDY